MKPRFPLSFPAAHLSITSKLTLLLLASTAVTVLAVTSYYGYVRRNDEIHQTILTTLAERCAAVHRRIDMTTPLTTSDRSAVKEFISLVEPVAAALERGGAVDGQYRSPLPRGVAAVFSESAEHWPRTRKRLLAFVNADPAHEEVERERLHRIFPVYQAAVDRTNRAMIRRGMALGDHMRSTLLLIVSVNGVFLVAGLWAARKYIVTPVLRVERAACRIAAGESSEAVPVTSADELGRLANAFNQMTSKLSASIDAMRSSETALARKADELEKANSELEQYAYAAAHDLQEPLRTVTTYSQMLRVRCREQLSSDAALYLSYVESGAARMRTLVRDLLSYSQAVHRAEARVPVDCAAAVQAAVRNCSVAIEETQARVLHDSLPTVLADTTEIELVFQNLISNAVKYRRDGAPPEVHITGEVQGQTCTFRVRDNGVGIDPAYHERIFGLFKRLHGPQIPGTGVGLALTRKIVEKHGGRIWVESQPGEGTTFILTLPVAESGVAAVA
jgi:signal transduction histidine kinase